VLANESQLLTETGGLQFIRENININRGATNEKTVHIKIQLLTLYVSFGAATSLILVASNWQLTTAYAIS
jgi:hypothetical protein